MKVLFITPRLPFDESGGGALKTKKLVSVLRKEFDLKVFCLGLDASGKHNNWVYEAELSEHRYNPTILNLMRSYLYNVPLSVYRNIVEDSGPLVQWAEWCDVIIVDHFFMFHYVPTAFKKRIVLHQHNAEYLLWSRNAAIEKNLVKRFGLSVESFRVKRYEAMICNRSNTVLAAPNDIFALKEIGVAEELFSETYHLGDDSLIDTELPRFENLSPEIAFIGNMSWGPNEDGVVWFLECCWGSVIDRCPNARFNIYGACGSILKAKLESYPNVVVHGFVDSLSQALSAIRLFISPLRYGSGMKVKNITAMYKGLPMVTTPVGAEGITIIDRVHAIIVDDKRSFADAVVELLSDDELSSSLSKESRKLAIDKYGWDATLNKFLDVVRDDC